MDVEANAIKTVLTDYMQKASQSLLQLTGAKGYRLDHIAGELQWTAGRSKSSKDRTIYCISRLRNRL